MRVCAEMDFLPLVVTGSVPVIRRGTSAGTDDWDRPGHDVERGGKPGHDGGEQAP
jgi:hypothetical protein